MTSAASHCNSSCDVGSAKASFSGAFVHGRATEGNDRRPLFQAEKVLPSFLSAQRDVRSGCQLTPHHTCLKLNPISFRSYLKTRRSAAASRHSRHSTCICFEKTLNGDSRSGSLSMIPKSRPSTSVRGSTSLGTRLRLTSSGSHKSVSSNSSRLIPEPPRRNNVLVPFFALVAAAGLPCVAKRTHRPIVANPLARAAAVTWWSFRDARRQHAITCNHVQQRRSPAACPARRARGTRSLRMHPPFTSPTTAMPRQPRSRA